MTNRNRILLPRRHSDKDGPDDTIGPRGMALAVREGATAEAEKKEERRATAVFAGPLVRTWQTLAGFMQGWSYKDSCPRVYPTIASLGDNALFSRDQICNDAFRNAVKSGASNFQATLIAHGTERCQVWARDYGLASLAAMAECLNDDEVATYFGHSPVIELSAWAALGYPTNLPDEFDRLPSLGGIVFVEQDNGLFLPTERIDCRPLSDDEFEKFRPA